MSNNQCFFCNSKQIFVQLFIVYKLDECYEIGFLCKDCIIINKDLICIKCNVNKGYKRQFYISLNDKPIYLGRCCIYCDIKYQKDKAIREKEFHKNNKDLKKKYNKKYRENNIEYLKKYDKYRYNLKKQNFN